MNFDVFEEGVDTLLEIEQAAVKDATGPVQAAFKRILALLVALWPGDDASTEDKRAALKKLDTESLVRPMDAVEASILRAAREALGAGVAAGVTQAAVTVAAFKLVPGPDLVESARYVGVAMRQQVSKGTILLNQATTLEQAQTALIVANPANRVESVASWITNKASNDGLKMVADSDPRLVLVWRSERDGCVHCLAYQGHSPKNGAYPAGLTFGKKPLSNQPVPQPPLHPHCRCTQWVLHKDDAGAVRNALMREAKRSILRGWSVESESETVRVDAAKRLLSKPNGLPKSVQQYAAQAVKRGAFKRGRGFPGKR